MYKKQHSRWECCLDHIHRYNNSCDWQHDLCKGDAKFVTENEDTSAYSFDAFTNYNPDGSSEGSGTAVFDEGATGELSFLSNTLAVYKNRVDSSGNGTFLMWHWK